jgi:hypothetical protein
MIINASWRSAIVIMRFGGYDATEVMITNEAGFRRGCADRSDGGTGAKVSG